MRIDGHNKIYLSRSQTRSMSAYEPIGDAHGGAAYGERNDPVTAAVVVGGSLIASDMQSNAASDAASMQAGAAQSASDAQARAAIRAAEIQSEASKYGIDVQKQIFDLQNEQQRPFREAGYTALGDIANLKPYLTKQFTPQDFAAGIDPGYAWRLQQGQMANQRAANVGGGALSGNTLAGLQAYTQGEASQEFGNAFNRFQTQRGNIYNTLAGIAGIGQTAVNQTGQAASAYGTNVGNLASNSAAAQAAGITGAANAGAAGIMGAANAGAAGTIGQANAWGGALQNAGNTYMLSKMIGGGNYGGVPQGYGTPAPQLNITAA